MKKLLFVICAALALTGCNSVQETPQKMAIDNVYKMDAKVTSTSKTAAEVVATMSSISLTGCPEAFIKAYQDYIKAWKNFTELETKMYKSNTAKAKDDIASFISNFQSDPSKATVKLQANWPAFAAEISKISADITTAQTAVKNAGTAAGAAYPQVGGIF